MEHVDFLDVGAEGFGLATVADNGEALDTWYPTASLSGSRPGETGTIELSRSEVDNSLREWTSSASSRDARRGVSTIAVRTQIASLAEPPKDIHDVYLRMHLLSMRAIQPRQANLDGFLDLLSDVAWTSLGPCLPNRVLAFARRCRSENLPVEVHGVFKVPRMTDYVVPDDVWIADASRVLLGAHLARGTAVMPEGFCGIDAGTLGPCIVEGRISLGAVVHEHSDVGGGASIMGTTSGGGKHRVTIGRRCLLGANSGVGISLGDDCVVEAGLYLTAGTLVRLPTGARVKAITLGTETGLTFRRNSSTGEVEAVIREKPWGELHPSLHRVSPQPFQLARPAMGRSPASQHAQT